MAKQNTLQAVALSVLLGGVLGFGLGLVLQTVFGPDSAAFWIGGLFFVLSAVWLARARSWSRRLGVFLMLLGAEGVAFLPALVLNYFVISRLSVTGVVLSAVLLYYSIAVAVLGLAMLLVGGMLARFGSMKRA